MPEINIQVGYCSESSQIGLLPGRLIRVVGAGVNTGGEIFYFFYPVFRQKMPAKGGKVEPFVGRALEGAIKKVEGVNIDVGFHEGIQVGKKQGPPPKEWPCALSPKLLGWVNICESYNLFIESVKCGVSGRNDP